MTITLLAISSALYAAASFCTARALSLCTRIALIATFLPPLVLFEPSKPSACAVAHGLLVGVRKEPRAAADRPEVARTESSEASSINLLITAIFRKVPGSMGGGVALPGVGSGSAANCGAEEYNVDVAKVFSGDSEGG